MGDKWHRTCDLTHIYYQAGRYLRDWAVRGICEKKNGADIGLNPKFTYYKLKDGSDVHQGKSMVGRLGDKQAELFPTKSRPFPFEYRG